MARDMVEAEVFDEAVKNPNDPAVIRQRWITELRRQGHRQCTGAYFQGDHACALGLLGEVAGLDRRIATKTLSEDIGKLAGLSMGQSHSVVGRNDGECGYSKHTFSEIADVVESWFRA